MSVQYSTAVRNAIVDAIPTAMGANMILRFYTGTQPANCATAEAGTLLASWTLSSGWNASSGGSKSLAAVPLSATGASTGTVGHYRFYDSTGTTCHEQGTVTNTGGGGDMTIDNNSIVSTQTVQITGYTKTAPGA